MGTCGWVSKVICVFSHTHAFPPVTSQNVHNQNYCQHEHDCETNIFPLHLIKFKPTPPDPPVILPISIFYLFILFMQ